MEATLSAPKLIGTTVVSVTGRKSRKLSEAEKARRAEQRAAAKAAAE